MYRDTWMEVDLTAIEENVRTIKEIAQKKIIAVLKADAYGCGDIQVAKVVLDAGAEMIAVSSLDEAMMLRNQGIDVEILILGTVDPQYAPIMIENNISTAAYSKEWVNAVIKQECKGLKVHLALDTGMNRIGFKNEDDLENALHLLLSAGVNVTGIFTHFFCSDSKDHVATNAQYALFHKAVMRLNYDFEWIHCDNSDATIFFKDDLSNACRLGISMYGISPYKDDLKQALGLYSRCFMIKNVEKGATIGYGATYTTQEDEVIGTVPIGYADGLIRKNQGRSVYIDGEYAEIVGRVCMDQCMIRLKKPHELNSVVEIFGEHVTLNEMAKDLETIPYEIICLISGRVTRVYKKNGQIISEANERIIKSEKQ